MPLCSGGCYKYRRLFSRFAHLFNRHNKSQWWEVFFKLEQINNLRTSPASSSCGVAVEPDGKQRTRDRSQMFSDSSVSLRLRLCGFVCFLKMSPSHKKNPTGSKVCSTKESHPRLSSPKITHTVTFFVTFNHVLLFALQLGLQSRSDVCPRNFSPGFILFSTS